MAKNWVNYILSSWHIMNTDKISTLIFYLFFLSVPSPPIGIHYYLPPLTCGQIYHPVKCVLTCFSGVWLFAAPWTVAHQALLSMGFSRQEYWSGLLCPPPGDLPNPGIEPTSLISPALAGGFFTTSATWEAPVKYVAWFYVLLCFHNLQKLSCAIDLIVSQWTTWL